MTAPGHDGPFRRDARVERTAECAPVSIAWDVATHTMTAGLRLPWYLAAIGLTTIALAFTLPGRPLHAALVGGAIAVLAAWVQIQLRRARRRSEEASSAFPRTCAFTRDTLVLAGAQGRTEWSYGAIRAVRRHHTWLAVELHDAQLIVLRDEPQLAEWLTARAPRLAAQDASSPGLTLFLLVVLYVLLCAAAAVVLPAMIPG